MRGEGWGEGHLRVVHVSHREEARALSHDGARREVALLLGRLVLLGQALELAVHAEAHRAARALPPVLLRAQVVPRRRRVQQALQRACHGSTAQCPRLSAEAARPARRRRGGAQLMKHVLPMLSSPVHGMGLPPSTRILRSTSGLGAKGSHTGRTGAGFGDGLPPLPLQLILCPALQSVHARSSGSSGRRSTLAPGEGGWVGVRCQARPRGCVWVTGVGRALQRVRIVAAAAGAPRSWHSCEQ